VGENKSYGRPPSQSGKMGWYKEDFLQEVPRNWSEKARTSRQVGGKSLGVVWKCARSSEKLSIGILKCKRQKEEFLCRPPVPLLKTLIYLCFLGPSEAI
jgi:hypothetical protein